MKAKDWPDQVYETLKGAGVRQVGYVPDAGHKRLIELCRADKQLKSVVLSTEEEGIGLAAGAWLGGARSALLMQSSGVGNCINALGMMQECRIPLLMLITMRGQFGEFNPWQVPMGQATPGVLTAMGVVVHEANTGARIPAAVDTAARLAYGSYQSVAVLISQAVIGIKSFQDQAAR
ncbi:MAG: thiamine pyrophosphate-binding protein [Betaproteobacteria bacterium]